MKTERYSVVLLGISADSDAREVKQKLARTFRVTPDKIEQLLSTAPALVKSGVDYQTALKYLDAIQHAGGACRIEPPQTDQADASSLRNHGSTLKTCPNCGYSATSADDPLLTAHDGQGECPACGIIVARFNRSREAMLMSSSPAEVAVEEPAKVAGGFKSAVLSHPWMSLLILVAVVILGKNLFFSSSGPESVREEAAKQAAAGGKQGEKKGAETKTVVMKILPGETRNFVLTAYLDYLHRDTFSPISFTPTGKLVNKWEEKGLHVEIQSSRITPITVSLWERLQERDDIWIPAGYRQVMSLGSRTGTIEKGKNMLVTPFAAALAIQPDETSWKIDPESPNFRRSAYILYQVEYELSISVPTGYEFAARDLTHTNSDGKTVPKSEDFGNFSISTFASYPPDDNAANLMETSGDSGSGSWKPTSVMNLRQKTVSVELRHMTGTEGVLVSPVEKVCGFPGYCELRML